jgi:SNF2 family DNA or RNA helicase
VIKLHLELDKIIDDFNEICEPTKAVRGKRLIGHLTHFLERKHYDNLIAEGRVKSENNNATYTTSIEINTESKEIISTDCNCFDHIENSHKGDIYICEHIATVFFKLIELKGKKSGESENGEAIIQFLDQLNSQKTRIDLSVSLTLYKSVNIDCLKVEFKIGTKRMYVLKNLKDFVNAKNNYMEIEYGKEFIFNPYEQEFSEEDNKIIDYINNLIQMDLFINKYPYGGTLVNGKYLNIIDGNFVGFLELCINKGVEVEGEIVKILKEDMPLKFTVSNEAQEEYSISLEGDTPKSLNSKFDVFLYRGNIYLPSKKQCENLKVFYSKLKHKKAIKFKKKSNMELFNKVIPALERISEEVILDDTIKNVVKNELKSEFYLDSKGSQVFLEVKLKYGNEALDFFKNNTEKIIIRDTDNEEKILQAINKLNFLNKNKKFVFNGDDELLYKFLVEGYKELEDLGEVYYSERFRSRKVYKTPTINAGVKNRNDGYLDFNFEIEDIAPKEYNKILAAFKDNRKFYKLKDNSFINLENKEIQEFFDMLDKIVNNENDISDLKLHKSKAIMLENYVNNKDLTCFKGKDIIKDISKKLEGINECNYELPKELKATLREYQITGFNWFKNLSYLGFGGVLADEMGLGKTIETIAFLLSEKNKKSLIISPTSVIYNWKNEFERFAPTVRVKIIHGNKNERVESINKISEYDVILTTYGTLRNDEEYYQKLNFDYCIIDEGQNIKNPLAQSSRSVKNINSKVKFALTGTPIENNLLELWSIFDFVMPGYLYTGNIFKKRFIGGDAPIEELQKYIKPFLLRRLKKDVIKELPDKIEKKYYVELPKEQKKIYSVFVKDIKEKIGDENFEGNKITMFSYLTKLRQLCLEPKLIVQDYTGRNGKLEAALEIITNNINNGHKIILFSQFTSVLASISKSLDMNSIEYMYLDGSTKASRRVELVEEFNNSEKNMVFLISLKAGGTGLNLTSADIVIHFDPWWNPSIEEQATDRAHRIGQKKVVQVFKLVAQGTIEERIISLQDEKKELIDNVMSAGYEGGNMLSSLTTEQIKELFV